MKTIPAPDEVSRLSKDLVDRVNLYLTDKDDQYQIMAALNALAGASAFFIVAASQRYHGVPQAWAKILPRHIAAMENLFRSVDAEEP